MVETYYVDHQRYPENLQALKKAAIADGYWKQFENPFYPTQTAYLNAEPDRDPFNTPETHWLFVRVPRTRDCRGAVMYSLMDAPQPAQKYRIFACDGQGGVVLSNFQPMVLEAYTPNP